MCRFLLFIFVCAAVPAFAQVDLQRGLVACYPFSGNTNDGSGHGYHGTVSGATLTTDRFGAAGSAYRFDGSDYIQIPAAPFTNSNYSYSVWARTSSTPGIGMTCNIFSIGDGTSMHQTVNMSNSYSTAGFVGITVGGYNTGNPPTTSVQSGILPEIDRWYHIVSVRVDNEMRMYVDGVLIGRASTNMNMPYYGTGVSAYFGARCNLTQFFDGVIDDVVIYNRALTEDEVGELYQRGIPCANPPEVNLQRGLAACYSFSGDATDGSGHGNNGTVNGASLTRDRYGAVNSAYSFDGIDDYIDIPAQPLIVNPDYTFSMWINVTHNPSYLGSATLFSIGQSSGRHVGLTLTNYYSSAEFLGWTSGGVNETGSDPALVSVTSNVLPDEGRWYHLVTTRDKDFLTLYVNGVYVGASATNGTRPLYFDPSIYTATLGMRAGLYQPLDAILDDVVIYDRAINAAEVYQLYTTGLPCSSSLSPTVDATDQTRCGGGVFTLTATGNAQYAWYDSETGGNLLANGGTYVTSSLTKTTSYYVSGTLNGIVSARKKVTVTVLPEPEIVCMFPDVAEPGISNLYKVEVTSGTQPFRYSFDFGDNTVVSTLEGKADHSYSNTGDYRVQAQVQDANNCMASCEASIRVEPEIVFIPNVITPENGDYLNDVFTLFIKTPDSYVRYTGQKAFSMIIENRWGREVFSTSDVTAGWSGQGVSSGVYYYLISFGKERYKGWVHVIK